MPVILLAIKSATSKIERLTPPGERRLVAALHARPKRRGRDTVEPQRPGPEGPRTVDGLRRFGAQPCETRPCGMGVAGTPG